MQVQKIELTGLGFGGDFAAEESYKTLLSNIQFCGGDVKLISITSCFPNEGKTTISIELSRELAEAGKKVLLIDADMRNSRVVQKHTRAKGIKGLSQLLSGQISLTEALYETQYKGFFVIFAGQTPPNPVELFNSSKFKSLLRSAGEIFDYVLIDTPPLGMVIDAAVIASQTDSSMLILDAGKISYRVAQSVYKQLVKSGSRVMLALSLTMSIQRRANTAVTAATESTATVATATAMVATATAGTVTERARRARAEHRQRNKRSGFGQSVIFGRKVRKTIDMLYSGRRVYICRPLMYI